MLRPLGNINKMDPAELKMLKKRTDIATVVVLCAVAILLLRLWYLQIQQGGEYMQLSESNRIRVQQLAAPRGNLLDRHGEIIVTNRPRFNVIWIREDAPHPDEVIKRLARILDLDISELLDRIRAGAEQPRFIPTRLKEDIDWRTLVRIENNSFNLPGVQIEVQPSRDYLYGNMASHLVGYLGEINRQELAERPGEGYRSGDLIGKMGIEKLFEPYLRGEKGRSYVEVDVRGFAQKQLQVQEPLPGNDIQLTLDVEIQQVAEKTLEGQAGAVVVMEVDSGRLLALASAPHLPLDQFVDRIPLPVWRGLLDDQRAPLLNKPVQGQYAPGSIYKIITALAGLEEGVITPETTYYCSGSIVFGGRRYHCWNRNGHGHVNLKQAMTVSCDVYFYQLGQRLGVDTLARYARILGLGSKTGIVLEHEKEGLVPTAAWKLQRHREPWQDGETLSLAIGQGFNLVTPLQVARMTAAVATGGRLYRPKLIAAIRDPEGNVIQEFAPELESDTSTVKKRTWSLLQEAMEAAVAGERATGRSARIEDIRVAGKTGTAQVVRLSHFEHLEDDDEIPYQFRDHAWFTAYAPADKPEVVVTVLVEHGGGGGLVAAPMAKTVLEAYFRQAAQKQEGDAAPSPGGSGSP
ncbi:MAG TPA: penicillin-binding protein 2 [Desulfurivibrio alkaliphilus]|uniref:Penicillin-binding protein 2 n=1 Tax=Desulfurivibrio alkaliphilus TaxID=427923 RepID=A0A7C2XEY9_9BACT|nr:penicillin-binding protein 2 [Desulfurivibrio alkaliphilus]